MANTAIDPWSPQPRRSSRRQQAEIVATLLWPSTAGLVPVDHVLGQVTGCAFMGVLMVVVTEATIPHPLVRPFLGTGVLGGYTTFSTYAVDAQHFLATERSGTALLYLAATLTTALAAVWVTAARSTRHRGWPPGCCWGWGPVAAVVLGGVTYVTSSGITAKVIGDLDWIGHRETPVAVIAWATVWIDNHLTADPLDIIGVLVAGVALAVGTLLPGPRTTRSSGGNEDRA